MGRTTYNITEVGTLTNTDGVLSGFSSSNFAKTPMTFTWGNNFEFKYKFTYVSAGRTQTLVSPDESQAYGSVLILANSSNYLNILLGSNNSQWNISPDNVNALQLTSGNTYYIKVTYDGTDYKFYSSTDDETYTIFRTVTSTTQVYAGLGLRLGIEGYQNQNSWAGSIDLNGCYVKINNQTVWEGVTSYPYTGTHIQLRRDTASKWSEIDPVLLEGEVGFETDTNRLKIGDGTTAYNSLTNNIVTSPSIKNMLPITQSAYDALATKDANTFYVIIPASNS